MSKRKKNKAEALAQDLRRIVEEIRADHAALGADWKEGGRLDPVSDCKILTGAKADHAALVLTYDGSGYEFFSYQSCVADHVRDRVIAAAQARGFEVQDENPWSMGFYA